VAVHSARIPLDFVKQAINSMDIPLSVLAHLKTIIVEVKAEENCLAHAILIAISRIDIDPHYNS